MEKGNFVIPKIRLSFWKKIIIILEDLKVLPGKYWFVWYDGIFLPAIILLFYLTFRSSNDFYGTDTRVPGFFISAFFVYLLIMSYRHQVWLISHAKELLIAWGDPLGFYQKTPFFNQNINQNLGWQFDNYHYSIQKQITLEILLSLFSAEFYREKPWYMRKRNAENRFYKTLSFSYLQNLPIDKNWQIIIKPKSLSQNIFQTKGLDYFPNLTGVNEFDHRYEVWSKNGQEALYFLNPLIILGLIHLTLPHQIFVTDGEVLISSARHFTRPRVYAELYTIAMIIFDALGGDLENAGWQTALNYFRTNPYSFKENIGSGKLIS